VDYSLLHLGIFARYASGARCCHLLPTL